MEKISESVQVDLAAQAADIDTADVDGAVFYDMQGYDRVMGLAKVTDDLTAGKVVSVQLLQATDASGTSKKVLGTAVTTAAASGALQPTARQDAGADSMDSDNGFTFVGIRIGTDEGSAIDGAGVIVRAGARNKPVS